MLLSDSALRAIAAATGDVWSDQPWRFDTADPAPMAQLAQHLHTVALAFNDNTRLLERALTRLHDDSRTVLASLAGQATIHHPHGIDAALANAVGLLERHGVLEHVLLGAYQAWRSQRPAGDDASVRYLLVHHGDPAFGVLTLHRVGSQPDIWLVAPDPVAASRFAIPHADRIVGEVALGDRHWQPTAHTNPDHMLTEAALTYRLPGQPDLAGACSTLLRWWQLRHSPAWRGRTPDQLTGDEIDALTR